MNVCGPGPELQVVRRQRVEIGSTPGVGAGAPSERGGPGRGSGGGAGEIADGCKPRRASCELRREERSFAALRMTHAEGKAGGLRAGVARGARGAAGALRRGFQKQRVPRGADAGAAVRAQAPGDGGAGFRRRPGSAAGTAAFRRGRVRPRSLRQKPQGRAAAALPDRPAIPVQGHPGARRDGADARARLRLPGQSESRLSSRSAARSDPRAGVAGPARHVQDFAVDRPRGAVDDLLSGDPHPLPGRGKIHRRGLARSLRGDLRDSRGADALPAAVPGILHHAQSEVRKEIRGAAAQEPQAAARADGVEQFGGFRAFGLASRPADRGRRGERREFGERGARLESEEDLLPGEAAAEQSVGPGGAGGHDLPSGRPEPRAREGAERDQNVARARGAVGARGVFRRTGARSWKRNCATRTCRARSCARRIGRCSFRNTCPSRR